MVVAQESVAEHVAPVINEGITGPDHSIPVPRAPVDGARPMPEPKEPTAEERARPMLTILQDKGWLLKSQCALCVLYLYLVIFFLHQRWQPVYERRADLTLSAS